MREKQRTIYISFDGKEFDTPEECMNYEHLNQLEIKRLKEVKEIILQYLTISGYEFSEETWWNVFLKLNDFFSGRKK